MGVPNCAAEVTGELPFEVVERGRAVRGGAAVGRDEAGTPWEIGIALRVFRVDVLFGRVVAKLRCARCFRRVVPATYGLGSAGSGVIGRKARGTGRCFK